MRVPTREVYRSIGKKRNMAKPEKIIMVGPCRVAIFRNPAFVRGKWVEIPKVMFEIRYRNRSGRWAGTSSMTVNEIPKAVRALEKAFDYLTSPEGRQRTKSAGGGLSTGP